MALVEKGNMPKKQQNIIISGIVLLSLLLLALPTEWADESVL